MITDYNEGWLSFDIILNINDNIQFEDNVSVGEGVFFISHCRKVISFLQVRHSDFEFFDKTRKCIFFQPQLQLLKECFCVFGLRGVSIKSVIQKLSEFGYTLEDIEFLSGDNQFESIGVSESDSIEMPEGFLAQHCDSINEQPVFFGAGFDNYFSFCGCDGAVPFGDAQCVHFDGIFCGVFGSYFGLAFLEVVDEHACQAGIFGDVHNVGQSIIGLDTLGSEPCLLECFFPLLLLLQLDPQLLLELLLELLLAIQRFALHLLIFLLQKLQLFYGFCFLQPFLLQLHIVGFIDYFGLALLLLQLSLQSFYFLQQLFVVEFLLLYVLFGVGRDHGGSLREPEGAEGFLVVGGGGGDGCDHEGLAVACEGLREDVREEGVAVGDVVVLFFDAVVGEGFDDDAEVGETEVDVVGLLEAHPGGSGFGLPFGACEVDDVELGLDLLALAELLVEDGEDGVAARGGFVHGMCPDHPDLLPVLEQPLHLLVRLADHGLHALDEHRCPRRLHLDLPVALRVQQVPQLLVVDLQVRHLHRCADPHLLVLLLLLRKDVLQAQLQQPLLLVPLD